MKVAILGSGISSLSLAFFLKQKNVDVTIYAKTIGGWLQTKRGFETGTQSIHISKSNFQPINEIITKLNLELIKSRKKRYFIYDGEFKELRIIVRDHVFSNIFLFFWNLKKVQLPSDLSVKEFFRVVFNNNKINEAVRLTFGTFIRGIYGADYAKWSSIGDIRDYYNLYCKSRWKFLKKAMSSLGDMVEDKDKPDFGTFTFTKGMSELPGALFRYLKKEKVNFTSEKIKEIGKDYVVSGNGRRESFDAVVSCIPAYELEKIIKKEIGIKFSDMTVVSLKFKKYDLKKAMSGFLVAPKENEEMELLGCTFDKNSFSHKDYIVTMIYKNHIPNALKKSIALLDSLLGWKETPIDHEVTYIEKGIPQYEVGHREKVAQLRKELPFYITGASFDDISVGNCIKASYNLSEKLNKLQ